jgi:hypothetical protein
MEAKWSQGLVRSFGETGLQGVTYDNGAQGNVLLPGESLHTL